MPLKNYSKMGFVVAHKDTQNKVTLQIGWSRQCRKILKGYLLF
jgi:hypothetical protein